MLGILVVALVAGAASCFLANGDKQATVAGDPSTTSDPSVAAAGTNGIANPVNRSSASLRCVRAQLKSARPRATSTSTATSSPAKAIVGPRWRRLDRLRQRRLGLRMAPWRPVARPAAGRRRPGLFAERRSRRPARAARRRAAGRSLDRRRSCRRSTPSATGRSTPPATGANPAPAKPRLPKPQACDNAAAARTAMLSSSPARRPSPRPRLRTRPSRPIPTSNHEPFDERSTPARPSVVRPSSLRRLPKAPNAV